MQLSRVSVIPAAALLVAACASSGGGASPSAAAPAPTEAVAPSASASASPTRIEVKLTDQLKIEPASITVPAGVPITFVVTNTGTIAHEFVLGDEAAQADHETEMAGQMGMKNDEAGAIGVDPGQTREITFTFDTAGAYFAGCHIPGHYAAGMKTTITVD
jgi:uncharacterized cupredoxin-like copper-binding protein